MKSKITLSSLAALVIVLLLIITGNEDLIEDFGPVYSELSGNIGGFDDTIIETETLWIIPEALQEGKNVIEVDGGDRDGHREPNVIVDVGFGIREYWAVTNEYGQVTHLYAKQIILQDDQIEPVTESGRYYYDEANVPGTERKDLDQGHIIADSLGGVANAYNITPQDSQVNRHGDQAYMEDVIRDYGGCIDMVATITYPDNKTQIPSHYHFEYTLGSNRITEDFPNSSDD